MAAAQVAAPRTVTRRTLDNGMVRVEVVLPTDAAATVWAALNAASAKAGAEPSPAEPPPPRIIELTKHQRLPPVDGSVPMRSWTLSRIACAEIDHRNRIIDAQPARTTNVGQGRGLAALHDTHSALAITAHTNASKWTGGRLDYTRCIDYLV
ncbi:MAG: hypothetical protein KBG15_10955 [Kofleriaceae bacterium]|nr:hypothetical protein [Kofleriaceae bacterium]